MNLATAEVYNGEDTNKLITVCSGAKIKGPRTITNLMHRLLNDASSEHVIIPAQISVNLFPERMECEQVRKTYEELFEAHLKTYYLLGTLERGEDRDGVMLTVRTTNALLQELEARYGNPEHPPFVATIDVIGGLKTGTPFFMQANPAELRCLEHFVPEDRRLRRHKEMIAALIGAVATAKNVSAQVVSSS